MKKLLLTAGLVGILAFSFGRKNEKLNEITRSSCQYLEGYIVSEHPESDPYSFCLRVLKYGLRERVVRNGEVGFSTDVLHPDQHHIVTVSVTDNGKKVADTFDPWDIVHVAMPYKIPVRDMGHIHVPERSIRRWGEQLFSPTSGHNPFASHYPTMYADFKEALRAHFSNFMAPNRYHEIEMKIIKKVPASR